MKVYTVFLVIVLSLPTKILSQIEFTTHIITPGAGTTDNPTYVLAADLDNDSYMDIVSASFEDNKVAWYENDGNQNFTQHIITTNAVGVAWLHAEDMDGDDDIDILSASAIDDKVAWYENDGQGNFVSHVIDSSHNSNPDIWFRFTVYAYDVDSDGDMDAMSGSWENAEVLWHENDGKQNFTTHVVDSPGQRTHVIAKDLDGDEDVDLISTSYRNNTIAWHENDGEENFTSHIISDSSRGRTIFAEDIDGDEDIDLAASLVGTSNKLEWYENDGEENFIIHEISQGPTDCNSLFFADVDNDSIVDIIFGCRDSDLTGWLKNDGDGNFTYHLITNDAGGPPTVWGSDIDSDGDIDLVAAGIDDDRVMWYESDLNSPTSVENSETVPLQFSLHQNYPNPFNPSTTIIYALPYGAHIRLVIYNILGQEVNTVVDGLKPAGQHRITVDMSGLSSGVYFYRLQAKRFNEMRKMLYLR